MFNYQPLQWIFLFFFYSFVGWCFESTYVSVHEKKFVNRGFIRCPFLPIYGSGGIMMLLVSRPFYDNVLLVYISGCIGATILEYVTSVVMETLFKVRYWDYSHKKIQFQGRISLESSLTWGLCTVVFTHYLQLPIEKVLFSIPYNILSVVTVVVLVITTCDFAIAFKTALDLRDVLIYMEKAKEEMKRMQKRLDVIIAFKGEEVRESLEAKATGLSNTAQGISSRAAAIGSEISGKMETITGKMDVITDKMDALGERMDAISEKLENSFSVVKEKMKLDPAAYMGNAREEILELYARYRVMMARFTPGPVKNLFEWYRERTIAGNPTMSSVEYKASMEEMKEKVKKNEH